MRPAIRTLIVSNHVLLSDGVAGLLEAQDDMTVVGQPATEAEAVRLVSELAPDVSLVALRAWQDTNVRTVRNIHSLAPAMPIVALQMSRSSGERGLFMRAGARSFLPWSASGETLLRAIRAAAPTTGQAGPAPLLSAREQQVLRCAARSRTNQQIATELRIKEGTVKRHLHSVFQKLGATSRLDAVTKAAHFGLIPGLRKEVGMMPVALPSTSYASRTYTAYVGPRPGREDRRRPAGKGAGEA